MVHREVCDLMRLTLILLVGIRELQCTPYGTIRLPLLGRQKLRLEA